MKKIIALLLFLALPFNECAAATAPTPVVHATIRTNYQLHHPEVYKTSTPVPINTTVNTVDQAISNAIYGLAVNAAEVYVIAQVPFLGLPLIKNIFDWGLNTIAGYVYGYLAQEANIVIINIQTSEEEAVYDASVTQLEVAYATGDTNVIATATSTFKTALGNLIHWDTGAAKLRHSAHS